MKFIGRLADVGIAKEASRGTAETSADFWLPKMTLTVDDGIEQIVDASSMGVIEDATDASIIGRFAEGQIEGNIFDKSFGLLLLAALGTDTPSGPAETTVYTHAFSVAQSAQHQSLTVLLDDPNQDYKYGLAMLKSLEIDIALKKFAMFKADFRSMVGATATLSPSYSAENRFLPQQASLKTATNLSGLGAASEIAVRSVKITLNKNVEDDYKLGSVDMADILNKQFEVSGTVELVFNDETFKTEMLADTPKAMRLRLTNTDVTIGTDMNPQLTIDLARVKFSKYQKKYSNADISTATVDFKAFYSIADSKMITRCINTQSSY